ncbi:MAG: hypothetical protein RL220_1779 [Bacteroidota bacterium]|jgi:hypothetical protein
MRLKGFIYIIILSAFWSGVNAQVPDRSDCHDSLGIKKESALKGGWVYEYDTFKLKRFPRRSKVTLRIDEYTLGDSLYKCNAVFSGKVKNETPILNIRNNLGVQLTLGRVIVGGERKYMYTLSFWKYHQDDTCWIRVVPWHTMVLLYSPEQSISGWSVGFEGSTDYLRLEKGSFLVE